MRARSASEVASMIMGPAPAASPEVPAGFGCTYFADSAAALNLKFGSAIRPSMKSSGVMSILPTPLAATASVAAANLIQSQNPGRLLRRERLQRHLGQRGPQKLSADATSDVDMIGQVRVLVHIDEELLHGVQPL